MRRMRFNIGLKLDQDTESKQPIFAAMKELRDLNGKRIAVYCASSAKASPEFMRGAEVVAKDIVASGASLVYGGGKTGLMGHVADHVMAAGGFVRGVMPGFLFENEVNHPGISELIQVENMRERKHMLMHDTEGIIALPGGTGTLEELLEALTLKRLGQYLKPVVIVNQDGFWDRLIALMDQMVAHELMRPEHLEVYTVVDRPEDAVRAIAETPDIPEDILSRATFKSKQG